MTSAISTYLGYRLYANDLTKSLQREAAAPMNATPIAYYKANIGKVRTVDDFVNNFKLFNYAMTAYGLSDMANAKGFMKKVLQSNLSDPNSFVNKLTDPRYRTFAKAYQFQSDGTIASAANVQTSAQKSDLEQRFATLSNASSDEQTRMTTYYEAHIGSIKSVDQLVADPTLYDYVSTAYGLEDASPTLVKQALASNIADPKSFAATALAPTTLTIASLNAPTTLAGLVAAYSTAAGFDTTAAPAATDTPDQSAAKAATTYFEATMPKLASLDAFFGDTQLTAYVVKAYGLPASTTPAQLQTILTSDSAARPRILQTSAMLGATVQAFSKASGFDTTGAAAPTDTAQQTAARAATAYYQALMPKLTTIDEVLADPKLTAYLTTAYNLPATTTPDQLKATLTGDPTNATGAAAKLGAPYVALAKAFAIDTGFKALAEDFNFAPDGSAASPRVFQSAANTIATVTAYSTALGFDTTAAAASADTPAKAAAKTATAYYQATIGTITSLDQFLADPKLTAYALKAYGLPSTTTTAQLKAAMTSDTSDTKVALKLGSSLTSLAAAYNVAADGTVAQTPNMSAQTKSQIAAVNDAYLWQTLETEATSTYGQGVGLAVDFLRKAPTLTDPYQILADKSLLTVVQTALGLSPSSSRADIDKQAKYISSNINFADFKDPAKLDKFISRFSALYDVKAAGTSSPLLSS